MNVTLRQLRAFIAVAEVQHFTRAAERLAISQSSISTLVSELERNLGLRLFDRHTRMLRLTHAGAEILPLARKALADLDSVLGSSSQLRTLGRGRVSIAASSLQAALLLPAVIRAYNLAHPAVKVELYDVTDEEVVQRVAGGDVDFGLGSAMLKRDDIMARRLTNDFFVALMPADHPLARKRELTWRDLREVPLISPPPGNAVREQLDFALAREGITLTRSYEVLLPLTILGMVEAGLGIAVMTSAILRLAQAYGFAIRRVTNPVIRREMSLMFHADRSLSPAAKQFRDLLLKMMRDTGDGGLAKALERAG